MLPVKQRLPPAPSISELVSLRLRSRNELTRFTSTTVPQGAANKLKPVFNQNAALSIFMSSA